MTKIINKVGSPFDIVTLAGPVVLPASGSIEAEFEPGYLEIICAGGYITVESENQPEPGKEPEPEDGKSIEELRVEYLELSGKDADKRWTEKRLAEEVANLLKA